MRFGTTENQQMIADMLQSFGEKKHKSFFNGLG
jgi:hypothetical protein